MQYPGTKGRAPMVFGNSKVYFAKNAFRLKKIGDRQDVQFSHKVKDPKEVWKLVVTRLKQLNPKS